MEEQNHLAKRHDHRYVNISSSIIFAINRDRKLANDTGGKRFQEGISNNRIIDSLVLGFKRSAPPFSFSLFLFRVLPRFVSTMTLNTMEIHLTWTINRP